MLAEQFRTHGDKAISLLINHTVIHSTLAHGKLTEQVFQPGKVVSTDLQLWVVRTVDLQVHLSS